MPVMAALMARRAGALLAIVAVVSVAMFAVFEGDRLAVAGKVLGPLSSTEQRQIWLSENGYDAPVWSRYASWLGDAMTGDFGTSLQHKVPVSDVLWPRLVNTAILAAVVLAFVVPLSLSLGILAGVNEGGAVDRVISAVAVVTTSVPEFASATVLAAVFVFWLGWLPGTSAMTAGFDWSELVLPALVLVLYDVGYLTRLTRAAMADAMASDYVRTAILKGLPLRAVIWRHAARNALIVPFTVIAVQLNWLLTGVVVVEVFFAYKGFGKLLLDAALFGDIYVLEACALVAVAVAVVSQLISDVAHAALDPRVRDAVRRSGGS